MSDLGLQDWEALARTIGSMQPAWVANGAQPAGTTLSVRYPYPAAAPIIPYVGPADQKNFVGARIVFGPGADGAPSGNQGFSTTIESVTVTITSGQATSCVLTLTDALPAAVKDGDTFRIWPAQVITVTAPENITEVGGVALPTGQSGNPNLPVTLDGSTIQVPTEHDSTAQLLVDRTTSALAGNGTYTTANAVSITAFRRLIGTVISDQSGVLYVQQSPDGTNWDVQSSFSVPANDATGAGVGYSVEVVAPYGRLYYENGATGQTVFRLYCWGVPEA